MNTSDVPTGHETTPDRPDAGLRIGDADRIGAIDELTRHFTEGRLDQTEFDDRTAAVATARTRADLAALFFDLPGRSYGDAATTAAADGAARSARVPERAGDDGVPSREVDDLGPTRLARTIVAVVPLLCVIAFFVLLEADVELAWLVFLLIPIVGILVMGPDRYRRHKHDQRVRRIERRRDRRSLRRG